jgi:hypothetical protein
VPITKEPRKETKLSQEQKDESYVVTNNRKGESLKISIGKCFSLSSKWLLPSIVKERKKRLLYWSPRALWSGAGSRGKGLGFSLCAAPS